MAIYIKIPEIQGNVTTKGFENAIEASALAFGTERSVTKSNGLAGNRSVSLPQLSEIQLSKRADNSSVPLFQYACSGAVLSKVEIYYCTTGSSATPYAKYTLHDVIISKYQEGFDEFSEHPLESLRLIT